MSKRINQTMEVSRSRNCPTEIKIGNNLYLVQKDCLGLHKQTLYSEPFKREREFDTLGMHYAYRGKFHIQGQLLEVDIKYYICFGPLGDRLEIKAKLDKKLVGDFRSLKSYCGGGSNGKWPNIKNRDWQIIFKVGDFNHADDSNNFSIEYYENIFPSLKKNDHSEVYPSIGYDYSIISKEYCFDEIQSYKQTHWQLFVIDEIFGNNLGVLSCCEYTGFKRYDCTVYGSFKGDEMFTFNKESWIGYAEKGSWLSTIEFNNFDGIEREILSGKCHMSIKKEEFKDMLNRNKH